MCDVKSVEQEMDKSQITNSKPQTNTNIKFSNSKLYDLEERTLEFSKRTIEFTKKLSRTVTNIE